LHWEWEWTKILAQPSRTCFYSDTLMNRFLTQSLAIGFASCSALLATAIEPTLSDVLRSTPKPANAVMHADLNALHRLTLGTPMEIELPANIDRVRIVSEIDFARLQPTWEIGYATMKAIPSAETVAAATGGYVEKVVNRDVVWTPNRMYLVPLPDRVLSIVRPADRRFLTQWLKRDRNPNSGDYLTSAANTALDGLALMIAVDVEDLIAPQTITETLSNFNSLKGKDVTAIANELANLRGVSLEVSRDTLTRTAITLNFREAPKNLQPLAKDFFNEVLQRRGSSIKDFTAWTMTSEDQGKRLQFRGTVGSEFLDDILGVFTVQRQTSDIEHYEKQPKVSAQETSQSVIAENSKEYFQKVVSIFRRVKNYSASNTGERAQWNGNMANRIDEIPTLNVDTEMVQFGAEMGKALRDNMVSMQLINISVGVQKNLSDAGSGSLGSGGAGGFGGGVGVGGVGFAGPFVGGFGGFYGGMGGGYVDNFYDPNSPLKYQSLSQSQGNTTFRQLVGELEQAIADMRRRMTEKYSIQF
jgi:hypothetical protein